MFNRRMFVALAACLAVTATSAFAGGNGGTKKDATIKVRNGSSDTLYVFVDVPYQSIQNAVVGNQGNPQGVLDAFHRLNGKQVAPGGTASFSVKGGNHTLTVVDIDTQQEVYRDRSIYVPAHGTIKVNVDDIDLPPPPVED